MKKFMILIMIAISFGAYSPATYTQVQASQTVARKAHSKRQMKQYRKTLKLLKAYTKRFKTYRSKQSKKAYKQGKKVTKYVKSRYKKNKSYSAKSEYYLVHNRFLYQANNKSKRLPRH